MNGLLPIFLDIETVPTRRKHLVEYITRGIRPPGNYKKPETIAAWERDERPLVAEQAVLKTSFDGAFGELIVGSFAVGSGTPWVASRGPKTGLEDERVLLADLFAAMTDAVPEGKHLATVIVGHGVRDFDLRFLWRRAVIHRLPVPGWIPWHQPVFSDRVYDTLERWVKKGERVSLEKLCLVLDLPAKGSELSGDEEIDGSKVNAFWLDGRMDELREYCTWDVERARLVYNLMTKVHQ